MSDNEQNSGADSNSREALEKAAMQDEQVQNLHAQLMREKEEPHEGFSPVPIFLMFIFAGLCFWGGIYFVKYSGGFSSQAFSPNYDPNAEAPKPVEISLYDRGAKIYRNQCAQCHQTAGNGVPGAFPPLAGSEWVVGHPEVTARILINGLNGPIEVKGNTFNGNMPSFGPSGLNLSNKDIAGVITYIRQEWGNEASEVTEQVIAGYAADYSSRSTPWTAAELKEGLGPIPEVAPATDAEAAPSDVDAGPDFSESIKLGSKVYKANCVACHQATGAGIPGVFPTLAASDWVTGNEERLARVLINGLGGAIDVNGTTYNGVMPPVGPSGSNLKAKEIAAVMTFIRQEWGNAAPGVTEEAVEAYLQEYGKRSTPWTADDVSEDLAPESAPVAEEAAH